MPIEQLLTRPVTQTRRRPAGARDALGNQPLSAVDVELVGYLELLDTSEQLAEGQRATATHRLFLLAGTDVEPTDRFTVEGQAYDVSGLPDHAWNPRTRSEHHVEVKLLKVEGA